jgi:hypothetical protein
MNSNRSLRLVKLLLLALLTACFGASLANAQAAQGKFNLPFEARWGRSILPPGNYSFTLDTTAGSGQIVLLNAERKAVFVPNNAATSTGKQSEHSELIITRRGAKAIVRALHLGDLGVTLYYAPPKGEPTVIAEAPDLIQRLPISMAGK